MGHYWFLDNTVSSKLNPLHPFQGLSHFNQIFITLVPLLISLQLSYAEA